MYNYSNIPKDSALYMILSRDGEIKDKDGNMLVNLFSGMPLNLIEDKKSILHAMDYYMINFDNILNNLFDTIPYIYGENAAIAGNNLYRSLFHNMNMDINYIISEHITYEPNLGDMILYNEYYIRILNEKIDIHHMFRINHMIKTFPCESFIVANYEFKDSIKIGSYYFYIHDNYNDINYCNHLDSDMYMNSARLIDMYHKKNYRLHRDNVIFALKHMKSNGINSWVHAHCPETLRVAKNIVNRNPDTLHVLDKCGLKIKYRL